MTITGRVTDWVSACVVLEERTLLLTLKDRTVQQKNHVTRLGHLANLGDPAQSRLQLDIYCCASFSHKVRAAQPFAQVVTWFRPNTIRGTFKSLIISICDVSTGNSNALRGLHVRLSVCRAAGRIRRLAATEKATTDGL